MGLAEILPFGQDDIWVVPGYLALWQEQLNLSDQLFWDQNSDFAP